MNFNEISKTTINTLSQLPTEQRNKLINGAVTITTQPSFEDNNYKIVEKLTNELSFSKEEVYDHLGLLMAIVKRFITSSDKEFNDKLLELGFSNEFITNLPFFKNREAIIVAAETGSFNKLHVLKWRVDISLSGNVLQKKVPKSVIFSITLKNGKKVTLTADLKTFHKLRFNVALLLKEMGSSVKPVSVSTQNNG